MSLYPCRRSPAVGRYRAGLVAGLGAAALLASLQLAASPAETSADAYLAGNQPERLDAVIATYETIVTRGGWSALPSDAQLAPGRRDPAVPALRERLRISGDYQGEMGADPLLFDAALTRAVEHFQLRHGLPSDGMLSPLTRDALNVTAAQRLDELRAARAAWAAVPAARSGRQLWVNIPEAGVAALRDGQVELQMRAIVGHPTRPTPTFSGRITAVLVDPPWNVPPSIARRDLLPRQRQDPEFFSRQGIRVFGGWRDDSPLLDPATIDWKRVDADRFPYRLRQDPGPTNSLGRYKFEMPNDFDVFLHDTPSAVLLGLTMRSLSSGCVRVADAPALARWLLAERAEDADLPGAGDERRTRRERLPTPVPVELVYLTAWVPAENAPVQFRRDIYGRAQLQ